MLRTCHTALFSLACASLISVTACGTDLGPCDIDKAERIVYRRGPNGQGCKQANVDPMRFGSGCDSDSMTAQPPRENVTFYIPYTEGQALVQQSCGNSGVCHSEVATGALRYGAPAGLNFDLTMRANIVNYTGVLASTKGHDKLLDWIDESWELIDSGAMPPGDIGRALQAGGTWFAETTPESGERFGKTNANLPALSTKEGKEIVRNWLACGAPAVNGNIELGQRGPDEVAPTWDDIHSAIISDTCVSCHVGAPNPALNGGLILTNACTSWRALVDESAHPNGVCADFAGGLVVPGMPEQSLLYLKLVQQDADVCGSPMPLNAQPTLSASFTDPIRTWIMNGALPPAGCN